jgi:hypothetical protein
LSRANFNMNFFLFAVLVQYFSILLFYFIFFGNNLKNRMEWNGRKVANCVN